MTTVANCAYLNILKTKPLKQRSTNFLSNSHALYSSL